MPLFKNISVEDGKDAAFFAVSGMGKNSGKSWDDNGWDKVEGTAKIHLFLSSKLLDEKIERL